MTIKRILNTFIVVLTLTSLSGQDGWIVNAESIDPSEYYGVTSANGIIGIVSSAEPLKVNDVILNGVYDYYQRGRVSNILKGFNHLNLDLVVNDVYVENSSVQNYRQSLDMRNASLVTEFSLEDGSQVKSEMMALRHLPYTALHIISVTAKEGTEIMASSVLRAPEHLQQVRNFYAEIDRPHVIIPLMSSIADSPSGNLTIAASNSFIFEEPHGEEPRLIHEDWDYDRHLLKFKKSIKAGETYSFAVVASTCASTQYEDPFNEAERLTIYAALEGKDRLLKRHNQAWNELWKSNITIESDPDITRDIRFALYHLYAFAREGTAFSLSPMGLSGLGYNGHVFWDTEIWMYPPLLMMQPDIARSLLEYRFERLDAARQNAFAHGYEGAMFPWESAADGSEDTPVWALDRSI